MKVLPLIAVLAVVASVCLAGCEGRPRATAADLEEQTATPSEDHLAEIDLRRGASEAPGASLLAEARHDSFADLILALRSMAEVGTIKGVFVRLGVAGFGLARAEEIGRALETLRKKKLPVVCHADGYGNGSMLLAARGCDEIWLSPAGTVETVGLAVQLLFGRSLLDRLKVSVDFLQVGKFKGASEPFTRDSSSPEARESVQTALRGIRSGWIAGIESGRGQPAAALGLEDGPHPAEAARQLSLVDQVGFEQEARLRAFELAGVVGKIPYFGNRPEDTGGIADLVRMLSGTESMGVPHVTVVTATGAITLGGSASPFGAGDGIVERKLTQLLETLRQDDDVKAVVLRIDSPGGSALASDLLWRQLMDLREQKPLVVSIGSMAASGGYYLAAAAHKIVAERTSIVGSIGVVGGKLSFADSLAEIGIHVEAVTAKDDGSARALYGSPLSAWDEATRAKVLASVESTYDLFLNRIAEGRGMTKDQIHPAAEGRIMGGDDGKGAGLVDDIGGLSHAITVAIELGKLDAAIPVQVVRPPSGLMSLLGMEPAAAQAAAAAQLEREAAQLATGALTGALLPFRHEIEAFRASVTPLLAGERVIAALPYALVLR